MNTEDERNQTLANICRQIQQTVGDDVDFVVMLASLQNGWLTDISTIEDADVRAALLRKVLGKYERPSLAQRLRQWFQPRPTEYYRTKRLDRLIKKHTETP